MTTSDGASNFAERRQKCSPNVRAMLDFLMTAAANAGASVEMPPVPEVKGEGVKYRNPNGQFCAIHPKHDEHVWILPAHSLADRARLVADLTSAGLEFTREDTDGPWVKVKSLQEAVRMV